MGFPKLTLVYQGQTLLEHAISKTKALTSEVFVIVGAYQDHYEPVANRAGAKVVINPQWSEGLAASLRAGVAALPETVEAALVVLPDQPFVSEKHLKTLINTWKERGAELVFSRYQGILGAPCVIDQTYFASVQHLKGDKGARALIRDDTHLAEVELSEFVDIDTPEEVRTFLGDIH